MTQVRTRVNVQCWTFSSIFSAWFLTRLWRSIMVTMVPSKQPPDPPNHLKEAKSDNLPPAPHDGGSPRHKLKVRVEFLVTKQSQPFNIKNQVERLCDKLFHVNAQIHIHKSASNEGFQSPDGFPTDTATFEECFPCKTTKSKVLVEMKLSSSSTLSSLKQHDMLCSCLCENYIWICKWVLSSLRASAVGFITGQSPIVAWRPAIETKLQAAMRQEACALHCTANNANTVDITEISVPVIEVTSSKVTQHNPDAKTKWSTDALKIRCTVQDAKTVKALLMSAPLNDIGTFVPCGLPTSSCDIHQQQTQIQNQFLRCFRSVSVLGIPRRPCFLPFQTTNYAPLSRNFWKTSIIPAPMNDYSSQSKKPSAPMILASGCSHARCKTKPKSKTIWNTISLFGGTRFKRPATLQCYPPFPNRERQHLSKIN